MGSVLYIFLVLIVLYSSLHFPEAVFFTVLYIFQKQYLGGVPYDRFSKTVLKIHRKTIAIKASFCKASDLKSTLYLVLLY